MLSLGPRSLGILSVKADFSKAAFGGRRHVSRVATPYCCRCFPFLSVTSPGMTKPLSASRGASINGHLTTFCVLRCSGQTARNHQYFARLRRAPSLAFLGGHAYRLGSRQLGWSMLRGAAKTQPGILICRILISRDCLYSYTSEPLRITANPAIHYARTSVWRRFAFGVQVETFLGSRCRPEGSKRQLGHVTTGRPAPSRLAKMFGVWTPQRSG